MPMLSLLAYTLLTATATPNIVLIVADDLGYGEPGCYGGTEIPTPNIDAIAARGVRMTAGYATCPMCAPSRAGLMTGKYPQRFGFEYNQPFGADPSLGLPTTEATLAERLKGAGYATGMVGKWHLGEAEGMRPWERGFDSFYGFLGGGSPYMKTDGSPVGVYDGSNLSWTYEYLTDAFTRRAVSFVESNADRPFFLYLAYNAVHTPYQVPERYLSSFSHLSGDRRLVAGMFSAMDQGIGEVRRALKDQGVLNNTLLVFISDNGGLRIDGVAHNGPFSGVKGTNNEGGIRVPFILSWPSKYRQKSTFGHPVSILDLVPTFMAAAGRPLSEEQALDGVDLMPYLKGSKSGRPHETLYWRIGDRQAIRHGDMKYITWVRPSDGVLMKRLYDLANDPGETKDLRSVYPEMTAQLVDLWNQWSDQMALPMWVP